MSGSLQAFLVGATQQAAEDLEAAFLRIPADKRDWKPMDKARTALDQAAEVAILTGDTADLVVSGKWLLGDDFGGFEKAKAELSQDWTGIQTLLKANIAKMVAAIQGITSISRGNLFTFPALLHRERYVTISLSCIFYPFAGIVIYLCPLVRGWLACSKRSIPTPYKIPMPGDV